MSTPNAPSVQSLPRAVALLQVRPSAEDAPELQVTVDAPNGWVAAGVVEGAVKAWLQHLEAEEANRERT